MISGATTAGLSTSLEDTRVRYEKRMNNSRLGFYVPVFFLIVSAIPLLTHLMPGLFQNLMILQNTNQSETMNSLIGRIFILLPATWLTLFFTRSYTEFFHLEREYAHKAALAKSVDGFKRQAPKYEEEITGEVFMEILNNPANHDSPKPAEHPLFELLHNALRKSSKKDSDTKE